MINRTSPTRNSLLLEKNNSFVFFFFSYYFLLFCKRRIEPAVELLLHKQKNTKKHAMYGTKLSTASITNIMRTIPSPNSMPFVGKHTNSNFICK